MSGRLILIGSGELAPTMVPIHRRGLEAARTDVVTVLDSPYGFQENADGLTERIRAFFSTSLGAEVVVAGLRRVEASEGTRLRALAAVEAARYLFAGPGSPSYALRVWSEAGIGDALARRLAAGATVSLASAAAPTAGVHTIPVYEIYKVGADPFWLDGLDLTGPLGLPMVVVPHWNNAEGGTHDTSRCYIGRRRFERLAERIEVGVVGIDEHTAAVFDFGGESLAVFGRGTVTLLGEGERVVGAGETLGLDEVGRVLGSGPPVRPQVEPSPSPGGSLGDALAVGDVEAAVEVVAAWIEHAVEGSAEARRELERGVVRLVELAVEGAEDPRGRIAGFVELILDLRARLRAEGRWEEADAVRGRLEELGVEVQDRPEGSTWRVAGPGLSTRDGGG